MLLILILSVASVSHVQAGLIHNITRVFNNGDIFNNPDVHCRPLHCSVYDAAPARNSGCNCQCPLNKPAFLQHVKKCADSISDCRMLYFGLDGQKENRVKMPTVFLPLTGQLLSPSLPLDWAAAGIKPDSEDGSVPCQLSSIGYLTHSGWIPLENVHLFALLNSNQHTHIQWLGNKQDQQALTGKIVEVSLQCQDAESPDVCAVFRVIGRDVEIANTAASSQSKENEERNNQLGLIVGIVCGVILAMSLLVITVFWTICWKQQKDRLAKKIHLHLLLQQRLQEQNTGVFRHFPRPYIGVPDEMYQNYPAGFGMYESDSHNWNDRKLQNGGTQYATGRQRMFKGSSNLPPPPPYAHSRKRLYFNPEFFEPDKMANPPPHAEEFLTEVRSMIDMARTRIRGRRYTPSLVVIPEEEKSSTSSAEIDFDKASVKFRRSFSSDDKNSATPYHHHTGDRMKDEPSTAPDVPEKVALWLSRHGNDREPNGSDMHGIRHTFLTHHYVADADALHNPQQGISWSKRKVSEHAVCDRPPQLSFRRRASCPSITTTNEVWPQSGVEQDQSQQPPQYPNQADNMDTYFATTAACHPFDRVVFPVPLKAFSELPYGHSLPLVSRRPTVRSFFMSDDEESDSAHQQVRD